MRILLATDAWAPQVNGVVRTYAKVVEELERAGHQVRVLHPDLLPNAPCPSYPEIRLALPRMAHLDGTILPFQPQSIHIATEGPLGWAVRRWCRRRGLAFTTAFHTRFAEYFQARTGLPTGIGYAVLRRFHAAAARVLVAAPSVRADLRARGFERVTPWSRGVDTALFRPRSDAFLAGPRPIQLYVGRIAVEKNLEAFLRLDTPGTKHVVGDGPALDDLRRRFPAVRFAGALHGEALARHFAAADVFVFPSRTDTFGLVLLEALASGVPVAAFPAPGPIDVIADAPVGCLDEDLGWAVAVALRQRPEACRDHAMRFSWSACAAAFLEALVPAAAPAVRPTAARSALVRFGGA